MSMRRQDITTFVEEISLVTDKTSVVNRAIQMSLERVFESHDFPFYLQEGVIQTVDDYTTGTVSVTNGSATVTGSGTTFTAAMVGRKIRIGDDNAYYRIESFTSATSIALDKGYQGTTDTAATYAIYQDEYRLPADVHKYKMMRQMRNRVPMFSMHPARFDEQFPVPDSYASPIFEVMAGTKLDTSTTGTVTASSRTLTGSGTSWASVEGLGRMSAVRIGDYVYHVKSVDSDTQITTFEIMTNVTSATAYEITLDNLVVQVYHLPDQLDTIRFRYFRIPSPLSNDYDLPDMPHQYHYLLCWGALSEILSHKGDINKAENVYEQRFVNGLMQMKINIGSFTPDRIYQRRSTDRTRRAVNDGLEGANYDRRYSLPR